MTEPRKYRAICFDLDGTLLPMDIDEFMTDYFKRIAAYVAVRGMDPELFMKGLKHGTQAMALSDDDRINKDVFWEDFRQTYGEENLGGIDARALADSFYEEEFAHIGDGFEGHPDVPRAIGTLKAKGYPILLTTMPMFPLRAVQHRLAWSGLEPDDFARITNYENSKTTKPRQTYFAENLAAMGLRGEDVLMVGNNTMEDFAFLDLGVDGYLITDYLLDPVGFDISTIKHGTFAEFANWVDALPDCANPATNIKTGPISHDDMLAAYEANAIRDIDDADANAKALADAIKNDTPLGKIRK